jgi:hypothetical protein
MLGEFWRSLISRYREDVCKPDGGKIRYIIRAREKGESASDIVRSLLVSRRRVEKLFDKVGKKIKFFSSIDEWVYWYNTIKPHGALDLKTQIDAYYEKMPPADILVDPSILEKEVLS